MFVSNTVMLFKYYACIKFSYGLSRNGAKLSLKDFTIHACAEAILKIFLGAVSFWSTYDSTIKSDYDTLQTKSVNENFGNFQALKFTVV